MAGSQSLSPSRHPISVPVQCSAQQLRLTRGCIMRGDRTPSLGFCWGLLLLMGGFANAADVPDLSKIDRRIVKEPAYKAKRPLYGLYVFGPQAKTQVWAIFDKSKPDAP